MGTCQSLDLVFCFWSTASSSLPPQVSFCYLFPQLFCRQPPSSTVCPGYRPPQGTSRAMHPDISLQQHRSVPRSHVDWVREVKYHSYAFRNPTSSLRFLTRGQYRHFPVWTPAAVCTQTDLKGFLPSLGQEERVHQIKSPPIFWLIIKLYTQTAAFSSRNKEELLEFRNKDWLLRCFPMD